MTRRLVLAVLAAVVVLLLPQTASAGLVNPIAEAKNVAVSLGRAQGWATPEHLAGVAEATAAFQAERLEILLADPERAPNPNPCTVVVTCPIDPRLTVERFEARGGIVEPVLFTARSGATLSGHVWAADDGGGPRPGVLIVNGSVVGYDYGYWFAAQELALNGYVVMTFDVQGEGMSDQFGAVPTAQEGAFAGTPIIGSCGGGLGGCGLPFYDGGTDALDFFFSSPDDPSMPRNSRTMPEVSHAAKQARRVDEGLNPAYNPLWELLDPERAGITGHSYGAEAASWLGQSDPRLDAVVAWDSLCVPEWPSDDELVSFATAPINKIGGIPTGLPTYGFNDGCFGYPEPPAPPLTNPALGINGDYLLAPVPYLTTPDPGGVASKSWASKLYSAAGVDSGNIVIRGGTHIDFVDEPTGAVPASLRGADLTAWYTLAWFDKYLQHDPTADARLLTTRWRNDPAGQAVDPSGDPNLLSYHFRSRLDVALAEGGRFQCENLRASCAGQPTDDGEPPNYSVFD